MSSDWHDTTLGEFIRLQRGHDLTAAEQKPGKVPIMGSAGPNGTHSIARASGPGVVVGRSGGSAGRVHFIEVDYWPHNTCLYVTDFLGNNPRFCYYLLQTLNLASFNSGSAQASINRNFLYPIKLRVPSRPLQDKIASFLQSIDHSIATTLQTNTTLEAIAQRLFRSWFVNFDPVHAKAAGKDPEAMSADLAALFPSEFEESALGLSPKGWKKGTIGENFILTMGQSPPGDTYNVQGDGLPFYQGRSDFGFRVPAVRMFCAAPTRVALPGDTLVSVRAPVGDVNMALAKCCIGRGVAAVRHPQGFKSFVFYAIRELGSHFTRFDGEGTVFGSINKKDFQSLPVTVPSNNLIFAFERVVGPIDNLILENVRLSNCLSELRDHLLPRLISGKLSLADAEAALAAVKPEVEQA